MSKKKRKNSNYKAGAIKVVTPETETVEFVPFEYEVSARNRTRNVSTRPTAALHYNTQYDKYTRLAMSKATSDLIELIDLEFDEDGYAKVDILQNKNSNEFLIKKGTQERMTSKISGKGGRYGINGTDFCTSLFAAAQTKHFDCKLWKDEGILLVPVKED